MATRSYCTGMIAEAFKAVNLPVSRVSCIADENCLVFAVSVVEEAMPVDGGRPGSIVSVVGRSKALSGIVADVQDSG